MDKIYIVVIEEERGPNKIDKIFKTHESATNYVKNKCGNWGSKQYDKPLFINHYDNYIQEYYNGYYIQIYNVED